MGYHTPVGGFTRRLNKDIVIHSCKFSRFNTFEFGNRTAIIRVPNTKKLVVWSSIPIGRELQRAIDLSTDNEDDSSSNYEIIAAIIPDIEHTLAAIDLQKQFPNIQLIGPSGISDKPQLKLNYEVDKSNILIKGDEILSDLKDFQFVWLNGHQNKELVTYFQPTKTLLAADLLFNIPKNGKNEDQYGTQSQVKGLQGWLLQYINPYSWIGRWFFNSLLDKSKETKSGLQEIYDLDFETIVVSHGSVIEENAKETFKKTFNAFLKK
ncbi:hypothetical protein WICMUC_004038 [Wickerhamomyces mucosus]|uniref:Uncharacterized protein n=1 Tax=Wickerhamomyces mucosus TaxID=1378264 RepID=A0A9P8TC34_9ASCO|nr:hypothetical protein WICMUC_004038 [Wickerhamomyces mucosus]